LYSAIKSEDTEALERTA